MCTTPGRAFLNGRALQLLSLNPGQLVSAASCGINKNTSSSKANAAFLTQYTHKRILITSTQYTHKRIPIGETKDFFTGKDGGGDGGRGGGEGGGGDDGGECGGESFLLLRIY